MKKYAIPIVIIIGILSLIVGTVYARPWFYKIKLDVKQAKSHSAYFDEKWPSGMHVYSINPGGDGKLRIDMSGVSNTWPVMEIEIGKREYRYTSQDGNSIHAVIPIEGNEKAIVKWGLTQGNFPAFYSYRFVLDEP